MWYDPEEIATVDPYFAPCANENGGCICNPNCKNCNWIKSVDEMKNLSKKFIIQYLV